MSQEQICDECNVTTYSFNGGLATTKPHKTTCSKYLNKGTEFFVGEKVIRKKEYRNDYWFYGDTEFTITHVSVDGKTLMFEREEVGENLVNAFESRKFEKSQ